MLINFWFRRLLANKSAFKAVVYNRFGDLALILALLLIFKVFKSFDFEIINSTLHLASPYNFNLFLIGLLLIIAALAKSAQIGLHGWLPDALEGSRTPLNLRNILIPRMNIIENFILPGPPLGTGRLSHEAQNIKKFSSSPTPSGEEVNSDVSKKDIFNDKCPSSYQQYAITGLLLSDGYIRNSNSHKRCTGNCRLEFTFKASVYEFICWLKFEVLKGLCTDTKPNPYPKVNPTQYYFQSKANPFITELYKIWYSYNSLTNKFIKIVPNDEFLSLYFNEVSLAYWIMGDGYYNNSEKTIVICTESFTYDDVIRLIKLLEEKYGLIATAQKRKLKNGVGYRIRFSRKGGNLDNLRKLVKPHMHPLMLYKLG